MSEIGAGSVRDLRTRAEWLGRSRNREVTGKAFGRWLRDLSALGHVEVNWADHQWSIAPPAVVRLPSADGVAVLSGARQLGTVDALTATDLFVSETATTDDGSALQLPSSVFVQFDSIGQLMASAAEVDFAYAGCFARRAASLLSRVRLGEIAAPPAMRNETLERRTGPRPWDWTALSAAVSTFEDGLYRFEVNGRWEWRTIRGGSWYRTGLSEGTFLELARTGESCLSWRAEAGRGRNTVGTVFVDFGAPLPVLQARVLTLCSGLPPRVGERAENLAYLNVPLEIARRVAHSLLQRIEE